MQTERWLRVVGTAAMAGAIAVLAGCTGEDPIESTVGQGWQLEWNDEFSGEEIDSTKWTHETNCWGGGNNEQQCYTDRPENSFLEDGVLVIRALQEEFTGPAEPTDWETADPNVTGTLPYTSARLRTLDKGDFTYGRIEVRAMLPGGQGLWPAVWMLPSDWSYGDWAASGEIDIVEAVNLGTSDTLSVHGTLHYGGVFPANVQSGAEYVLPGSDPREDFHTYAIEWAQGEIRWYVDDVHYATQTSAGWFSAPAPGEVLTEGPPFDEQRFHLLLNVAVGGAWPGNPDSTTVLPQEMKVDFVRVYSCPESPRTLEACATTGRDAVAVAGQQPPNTVAVPYDPGFIDQDVVTVMADEVVGPYQLLTYVASGAVDTQIVEDAQQGAAAQITFDTNESVAFFQSLEGFDFSEFSVLDFDVKVVADPRQERDLFVKMDCFFPCGTGDFPVDPPPIGEWTHYSIPLADLVAFPGSTLDLTTVNTPLVIFPGWGDQSGVQMLVDNVTISR